MRKRIFRTISSRLTMWGAGITLAVCALLSVVLYAGLLTSMRDTIDTFLEGEVHEFMLTVNDHPGDDAGLQQAIRLELGSRSHNDLAFRLFDEKGGCLSQACPMTRSRRSGNLQMRGIMTNRTWCFKQ